MTNRKTKKPVQNEPRPALSPFDVEETPEAKKALSGTIGQIVTDFLAKGIRQVNIPTGQVNDVKSAFEAASSGPDLRRWRVEIARVSGILTEIRFHTSDDPVNRIPPEVLANEMLARLGNLGLIGPVASDQTLQERLRIAYDLARRGVDEETVRRIVDGRHWDEAST